MKYQNRDTHDFTFPAQCQVQQLRVSNSRSREIPLQILEFKLGDFWIHKILTPI